MKMDTDLQKVLYYWNKLTFFVINLFSTLWEILNTFRIVQVFQLRMFIYNLKNELLLGIISVANCEKWCLANIAEVFESINFQATKVTYLVFALDEIVFFIKDSSFSMLNLCLKGIKASENNFKISTRSRLTL